jgi:AraC family transcriptional regulator, regulatory protein of adaptative response / methylated-DNA-[protein]-cysteine methyltransferase
MTSFGFSMHENQLSFVFIHLPAMNTQQHINYTRIAEAIEYIKANFKQQPNLDEVAERVNMSSFHFQKIFSEWAGVSPKKFLQYISVEHAKKILKEKHATLFDAAYETGLSGTGRLHDLFIKIEGMTPGEYKTGGDHLLINCSFAESPFGNILVASTIKGICYMAFADDEKEAFFDLQHHFPNAQFRQVTDLIQQNALYIFTHDWNKLDQIKLHLKGTDFQIKVWETNYLLTEVSPKKSIIRMHRALWEQPLVVIPLLF